jgi:hypothetical protein
LNQAKLSLGNDLQQCRFINPQRNWTTFEPGNAGEKRPDFRRKPTAANDDGLISKDSRGDKTLFELFLGPFAGWNQVHWDMALACNL